MFKPRDIEVLEEEKGGEGVVRQATMLDRHSQHSLGPNERPKIVERNNENTSLFGGGQAKTAAP